MEPADLNSSPDRDDAHLEALLREPAPPLADAGFSNRVLAALPPPNTDRSVALSPTRATPWRGLLCAIGALAGVAVAFYGLGWPPSTMAMQWQPVEIAFDPADAEKLGPVLGTAIVTATISVMYALRGGVGLRLIRR